MASPEKRLEQQPGKGCCRRRRACSDEEQEERQRRHDIRHRLERMRQWSTARRLVSQVVIM
jgi:hypothetical protein